VQTLACSRRRASPRTVVLRHSYACLLLHSGAGIAYVQRQLGPASQASTVDTYEKWLPLEDASTVRRLDDFESEAEQPGPKP
jgi:integrase